MPGTSRIEPIEVGYHVFVSDGGEEVGAVREVRSRPREELIVYVENSGDFAVPLTAVSAVHFQKVVLDSARLDPRIRKAIDRAHDGEV